MLQQVTNFARHMNKNNYFTRNAYLKGSFEIFKDVGTLIFQFHTTSKSTPQNNDKLQSAFPVIVWQHQKISFGKMYSNVQL